MSTSTNEWTRTATNLDEQDMLFAVLRGRTWCEMEFSSLLCSEIGYLTTKGSFSLTMMVGLRGPHHPAEPSASDFCLLYICCHILHPGQTSRQAIGTGMQEARDQSEACAHAFCVFECRGAPGRCGGLKEGWQAIASTWMAQQHGSGVHRRQVRHLSVGFASSCQHSVGSGEICDPRCNQIVLINVIGMKHLGLQLLTRLSAPLCTPHFEPCAHRWFWPPRSGCAKDAPHVRQPHTAGHVQSTGCARTLRFGPASAPALY